jgi:hypothetical protein
VYRQSFTTTLSHHTFHHRPVFLLEAINHITISMVRPQWEWTSTALTITAFWCQNLMRAVMIPMCIVCWRGIDAQKDVPLQIFFRFLVVLVFLEFIELFLKFFEVHAICSAAPVVKARSEGHGMTEEMCELVSDFYDFVWQVIRVLLEDSPP